MLYSGVDILQSKKYFEKYLMPKSNILETEPVYLFGNYQAPLFIPTSLMPPLRRGCREAYFYFFRKLYFISTVGAYKNKRQFLSDWKSARSSNVNAMLCGNQECGSSRIFFASASSSA